MGMIEHAAIWTPDLARARLFYERYFNKRVGDKYMNKGKQFASYFLRFGSGARLELMHKPASSEALSANGTEQRGYAHLAFSVGSERAVNRLTKQLRQDGCEVASEPRRTGDGYYESVVLDPDGNRVEITG
jgi:lactoylglutathione lyase